MHTLVLSLINGYKWLDLFHVHTNIEMHFIAYTYSCTNKVWQVIRFKIHLDIINKMVINTIDWINWFINWCDQFHQCNDFVYLPLFSENLNHSCIFHCNLVALILFLIFHLDKDITDISKSSLCWVWILLYDIATEHLLPWVLPSQLATFWLRNTNYLKDFYYY